jgi:hypothetical protein
MQMLSATRTRATDRLYSLMMMVYNAHNYWVFGLGSSCGILKNTEHSVSGTGIFFRPHVSGEVPSLLGL